MVWNKKFLKIPLWDSGVDKSEWNTCCAKGLPYAYFTKGRKYGEYCCDLLPVKSADLALTEEGTHEIAGMFEAFFARWYINKMLPKNKQVVDSDRGPWFFSISPCPVGKEAYVHYAMCRILTKHLQPTKEEDKIPPQFERLCAIEPQLLELYREAKSYEPTPDFCANRVWYREGGLKERLLPLVGWLTKNPALRSSEAYDIAYETIWEALPDCQHQNDNIYCL